MSADLFPATLIVVSCNKLPYTRLCLERMLECEPAPAQVVVVDNGSEDGSHEYLAGEFLGKARTRMIDYALVANETNAGACTARNQALEVVRQRYVAFADNDLAPRSRDWLARLGQRLEAGRRIGIAGPRLLFPFPPYSIECAGVAISPTGRVQYRGRGQAREAYSRAEAVQCLISACWLMKREVCEEVGALDEAYNPAQFEDFDYCYRAREAGWEVWYEPGAELYHFENTTTGGTVNLNFQFVTLRNWKRFRERWQHRFSQEDGPDDDDCRWEELPTQTLDQTGSPPWG